MRCCWAVGSEARAAWRVRLLMAAEAMSTTRSVTTLPSVSAACDSMGAGDDDCVVPMYTASPSGPPKHAGICTSMASWMLWQGVVRLFAAPWCVRTQVVSCLLLARHLWGVMCMCSGTKSNAQNSVIWPTCTPPPKMPSSAAQNVVILGACCSAWRSCAALMVPVDEL